MSASGAVEAYSRAEGENMALHAIGLASRRDDQGLRDHLKAVLGRLGALGLPEAGVAPWFLTVVYLAPEVALDDAVVATLYETLWDRYGNNGVAAARFFLEQGDLGAAKAILATLLQHRGDEPEVRSLAVTCRLVSGFAGASRRRPST
jgi:hypothetical protein